MRNSRLSRVRSELLSYLCQLMSCTVETKRGQPVLTGQLLFSCRHELFLVRSPQSSILNSSGNCVSEQTANIDRTRTAPCECREEATRQKVADGVADPMHQFLQVVPADSSGVGDWNVEGWLLCGIIC